MAAPVETLEALPDDIFLLIFSHSIPRIRPRVASSIVHRAIAPCQVARVGHVEESSPACMEEARIFRLDRMRVAHASARRAASSKGVS